MGEEKRREPRVEVKLAIRVACGTLDEFAERYALNLSRGGLFVRARDPSPAGTPVSIDIQLATGQQAIRGRGVVAWTSGPSAPGEPLRRPGMGIRFTDLAPDSAKLVDLVVATQPRAGQGSEPPGPPEEGAPAFEETVLEPPAGAAPAGESPAQPGPRGTLRPSTRAVGIDLGTTNSCVAVAEGGKARVLASRQGWSTIPSVVAYDAHGRLLVGHPARAQMVVNPRDTVYGSKRLVGRPFQSPTVQACRDRFHYDIVEGAEGEAAVRFAGRAFSLAQISAFVLAEVRQMASQALGEEVTRAVVTVPAYYNDHQRQAVREAGRLAGLTVERIVNEPTAAALAYGFGRGLSEKVLVYDLGGGTFDASVVDVQGEIYEVLSTGGDTFLGGVDFDNQLVDHVVYRFMEEQGFAPPADRGAWQRIRDAAEEAKVALSAREKALIHVPYLCRDAQGEDVELRVEVTREELEQLTARLVDRTVEVCTQTLAAKGIGPGDLDQVLLVGGQSRMPLVWKRMRELTGKEPSRAVHPDEAVALGAALLADTAARIDSVVLIDVLAMGIGVGLPGGRMAQVLPRNTRLPARKSYELATVRDGQTELELAVFQGDSAQASECEYLGTVKLGDLPARPRGQVRVAVEFTMGQEGILSVSARDLASGKVEQARLATRDTPEVLRAKLQMPQAPSPARGAAAPPPQGAPQRRGFFGRLFGKRP
ncbi:MAG: TIGR02266 family protein [Deltaproteobacteria bacterium]|nr:TIGR02266 family protein [Deltaproteobacteria bacterium]